MMLDILEVFLKHWQHRYIRLDGKTQISDRYVTFLLKMREKMYVCMEGGEVTYNPYFCFPMYRILWSLGIDYRTGLMLDFRVRSYLLTPSKELLRS